MRKKPRAFARARVNPYEIFMSFQAGVLHELHEFNNAKIYYNMPDRVRKNEDDNMLKNVNGGGGQAKLNNAFGCGAVYCFECVGKGIRTEGDVCSRMLLPTFLKRP